nr:uncharacterized protein LOC115257583 [Aedes albopictus]
MPVVPNQNDNGKVRNRNNKPDIVIEEDSDSDRADVCFLASKEEELVKMQWFLDSGATDHMVKDSRYFSQMRRLDRPVEVIVANGEKLVAEYCGDIFLYAVVGGKTKKCVAKDVLYLPGLSCNLFSVNRVARSGLQVRFVGDKAEITKDGSVMAVGQYTGKLYGLDMLCKCRKSNVGAAVGTTASRRW